MRAPRITFTLMAACAVTARAGAVTAAEPIRLVVELEGVQPGRGGHLRCGLYASGEGFPMKPEAAIRRVAVAPTGTDDRCVFELDEPGRYAVAVGHDEDGNEKVNTNFFGIPTEGWGTSNNVRPAMRAPRFAESAFHVGAAGAEIVVKVGY